MVEMQDQNGDPQLRAQLGENPQHGHRIRAARHTDTNPVPRPNHGVAPDCFDNSFVELFAHANKQ
jgi:hypothetical protein